MFLFFSFPFLKTPISETDIYVVSLSKCKIRKINAGGGNYDDLENTFVCLGDSGRHKAIKMNFYLLLQHIERSWA